MLPFLATRLPAAVLAGALIMPTLAIAGGVHQPITGQAQVVDGDTLSIADVRIRLHGLDAPELGHHGGEEARQAMRDIVGGHTLTCRPDGTCIQAIAVTTVPIIIDGDTLTLNGMRIRLEGPDTPENFRPRCDAELVVALKAKQRLRELVGDGSGVIWEPHGRDRYGRVLARVYTSDGHEVGETLVSEGLAVRWAPGRAAWLERARHWCGSDWSE